MKPLYALGALPLLFAGKGCLPAAPNNGQLACATWQATGPVVSNAAGCFTVRGGKVYLADKAVDGRPFCVRVRTATGLLTLVCVADAHATSRPIAPGTTVTL